MTEPLTILDTVLKDRGSRYAVSGAPCASIDEAKRLIKELKRNKKFAKATHNTWALITPAGPIKNDNGEGGAGQVILSVLEGEELQNHLVIVTRWFGGKHLGGDRFRHVATATKTYIDTLRQSAP